LFYTLVSMTVLFSVVMGIVTYYLIVTGDGIYANKSNLARIASYSGLSDLKRISGGNPKVFLTISKILSDKKIKIKDSNGANWFVENGFTPDCTLSPYRFNDISGKPLYNIKINIGGKKEDFSMIFNYLAQLHESNILIAPIIISEKSPQDYVIGDVIIFYIISPRDVPLTGYKFYKDMNSSMEILKATTQPANDFTGACSDVYVKKVKLQAVYSDTNNSFIARETIGTQTFYSNVIYLVK
jgi:hypothetical protein